MEKEEQAKISAEREARGKRREDHLEAGRQLAADEYQAHLKTVHAPAEQEETFNSTDDTQ
jgi:hypothetical protein